MWFETPPFLFPKYGAVSRFMDKAVHARLSNFRQRMIVNHGSFITALRLTYDAGGKLSYDAAVQAFQADLASILKTTAPHHGH